MRIRSFTKRLTPWLTAYLLLVSVGLPLQRVYCACVGAEWVTILPEDRHNCRHEEKVAEVNHHHGATACCSKGDQADKPSCRKDDEPGKSSCLSKDCGDSEVLYAQLDVDFISESTALMLPITAILLPESDVLWGPHHAPVAGTPIRGPTPPPPLAGRQLLVAHQTFLI